jgi:hypothetical protein
VPTPVTARRAFIAVLVGALGVTAVASAQQPSTSDKAIAERLYNDAIVLMQHNDYAGACPKFAESLRMQSGIGTMLRLADCYEKQGKLASAWAQFREAAEIADKASDSRAAIARQRASAVEPRVSTLTIVVPPAAVAEGLEIKRDGSLVGRGQWGAPIPVDSGSYTVSASAPHRAAWSATVQVAGEHASQSISIPVLKVDDTPAAGTPLVPPPVGSADSTSHPPIVPPPPASGGLSTRQILGISIGGAGIIGLGLGTYFGLHAKSLYDSSNASGCDTSDNCTQDGGRIRNSARDSAMGANIAFTLGLAAIAGGAVIYFTAPKEGGSDSAPRVGFSAQPLGRDGALFVGHASW